MRPGGGNLKKKGTLLAFILLVGLYVWFQVLCRTPAGDTVLFLQFLEERTVPELLLQRLEHVTTRVVLEAILFLFLKLDWGWFVLFNTGAVLLTVLLLGLYGRRMGKALWQTEIPLSLAAFLFLLYPLTDLTAAGIPPSFINYVWSGALGLFSLLPFLTALGGRAEERQDGHLAGRCGRQSGGRAEEWPGRDSAGRAENRLAGHFGSRGKRLLLWIAAACAAIPAGNMEQMAVILLAADSALLLLLAWRLQKAGGLRPARREMAEERSLPFARREIAGERSLPSARQEMAEKRDLPSARRELAAGVLVWFLVLLSVCFHLRGGNAERMEVSIRTYWPDFGSLHAVQKAFNGIASTVNHLLSIPNLIFLSFALLLFLLALTDREKRRAVRLLGMIPLLWESLVLALKAAEAATGRPWLLWINGVDDPYTEALVCPAGPWLPLLLQGLVLAASLFYLWDTVKPLFWRCVLAGILGVGFASRVMLGFSPTLYASHTRTFYYFYLAVLLTELVLAARLKRCSQAAFLFFCSAAAGLGTANFIRMAFKAAALL